MEQLMQHILFIGAGAALTLQLLLGGIGIGLSLALLFSVLRHKGIGTFFINSFISVIRGTPLILQLSLVYFSVPGLLGFKLSVLGAGLLTFGLNSSAYIAEILRAGIESLPKGQIEAAKTLHVPSFYMWKDIILPQVFRSVFPAMVNEIIALLKETALISTIGGLDIMRRSNIVAAEQFTYFGPLCIAGVCYYVLVLMVEYWGKKMEARVNYVSA